MYPRSGRFTTIPTDANLGNLNLFPFKVSSLFHAKPSINFCVFHDGDGSFEKGLKICCTTTSKNVITFFDA